MKQMASFYTHIVSNTHIAKSLNIYRLSVFSNLFSSAHIDPAQEESEFFVRADFNLPIDSAQAKLLYFLKLGFTDIDIAFGAGKEF